MSRRKDNKGRVLRQSESQRQNGSYDYRWRDKSGRRHSVYAKTLKELREKKEEVFSDRIDGLRVTSSRVTLNDMYNIWVKVKRGLKPNTLQNYKYMYETFVMEDIGEYSLIDIRKSDIRIYYNQLVESKGFKIRTLDSIHTVLYQVLELAVEEDRIRTNPASEALTELRRTHNAGEKKRKALTLEEQMAFEKYLGENKITNRWKPIFTIMLNTCLRVGEVTGLTWDDIDFVKNTISVNRKLVYYKPENEKSKFIINTPKTKNSRRVIPMIDSVKEVFHQEFKIQKDLGIKQIGEIEGITNFVFINRFGNPINQAPSNKALRKMVRLYNEEEMQKELNVEELNLLPRISCHTLRHTFTTRQVEAGTNLKVLQEVLGHSDIRTTMDIYAEATEDLKQKEFEKYQKYIRSEIANK